MADCPVCKEELEADHKKAELMWWDEKGVLEDRIAELEARHDNFLKEFWKTNADNEGLVAALEKVEVMATHTGDVNIQRVAREALAAVEGKDDD